MSSLGETPITCYPVSTEADLLQIYVALENRCQSSKALIIYQIVGQLEKFDALVFWERLQQMYENRAFRKQIIAKYLSKFGDSLGTDLIMRKIERNKAWRECKELGNNGRFFIINIGIREWNTLHLYKWIGLKKLPCCVKKAYLLVIFNKGTNKIKEVGREVSPIEIKDGDAHANKDWDQQQLASYRRDKLPST